MTELPTPDPSVVASIQHQAEKLGYLVAQVEAVFHARYQIERYDATVVHAIGSTAMLKKWMEGGLTDDEYSLTCAEMLKSTTDVIDSIKAAYEHNTRKLQEIVGTALDAGKSQYGDLEYNLDQILRDGE